MTRIKSWLRHAPLCLATALALLAASASARAADLTVYTALEADQLKAYKAAFEKTNPDVNILLGARLDRHHHRQAAGREGQPARPTW